MCAAVKHNNKSRMGFSREYTPAKYQKIHLWGLFWAETHPPSKSCNIRDSSPRSFCETEWDRGNRKCG